MSSSIYNEQHRFGSASWATEYQLRRAGMFEERGLPVGFYGDRRLWLDGDAPIITFGGAGTGKLTKKISYILGSARDQSMLILDPRGEIAATFMPALAHHRIEAFLFNPFGLHGMPRHACNPLDLIDPRSPTFHADCKLIARSLVNVSSRGDGKYFEQRGSSWVESIIKLDAELMGSTSLPALMRVINLVESGSGHWPDFLEAMTKSTFDDVRRTAGEMLAKQQDSPREFGSIMGEIYASLACLDDPVLLRSLQAPDFSIADLCRSDRTRIVFLMIPAEYLPQVAPVLRLIIAALMLYKSRSPASRRVLALVDEAAQLGAFDLLKQLYTYARGINALIWSFWQGVRQIETHHGPTGVETFLSCSGLRDFLGVRDFETAKLVSNMLGTETLEYDDTRMQEAAVRQKRQAMQRVWEGEDLFTAMMDVAHFQKTAQLRTKQARSLRSEAEVLGMSGDRQIMFVSGTEPLAIEANAYPYFTRPEMAGLYLSNPYHPPHDSVQIATRWGSKRARIIREPVPREFSSFAQYQDGTWAYVEGYKPT